MKKKTESDQIAPTNGSPLNLIATDLKMVRLPVFTSVTLRIRETEKALPFADACELEKSQNMYFLSGIILQPERPAPQEYYPPSDEEELELGIIAILDATENGSNKYVFVDLRLVKEDGKLFAEYKDPLNFTRSSHQVYAAFLNTTEESAYWYNISKARQSLQRVDYQLFKAVHDALHYAYWSDLEYVVPKKEWPGPALIACGLIGSHKPSNRTETLARPPQLVLEAR